jgi:hypothetical protein
MVLLLRDDTMLDHGSEVSEPIEEPLSDDDWFRELVAIGVAPLIAQAQVRHRRDLPELLKEHPGEWVAYLGAERLAIGKSERELTEKCIHRGLKDDEFLVRAIAKHSDPVIDATTLMQI